MLGVDNNAQLLYNGVMTSDKIDTSQFAHKHLDLLYMRMLKYVVDSWPKSVTWKDVHDTVLPDTPPGQCKTSFEGLVEGRYIRQLQFEEYPDGASKRSYRYVATPKDASLISFAMEANDICQFIAAVKPYKSYGEACMSLSIKGQADIIAPEHALAIIRKAAGRSDRHYINQLKRLHKASGIFKGAISADPTVELLLHSR